MGSKRGASAAAGWTTTALPLLCAGAVLLRLLVGLSSYSGANTPPKYGDYEAQRHWMEITTSLPVTEWYTDSKHNGPDYWPLDYPPLSGYQSWLHGHLVGAVEPAAVALGTSRGYETPTSKALLRWTVVLSDLAVFFPAALLAARFFQPPSSSGSSSSSQLLVLAALLLNPAHVLIDHGHFQYNCISLGLALGAAVAIAAAGWDVVGSVLFCAALSHKQMSLFYAPAFFAHLLGRCLERPGVGRKVAAVAVLGVTVIASFAVMWAPYLRSPEELLKVIGRIFPLRRGLYEDYLGNWWCATSVAIKWKDLVDQALLVRICAGLTLLAAGPSMAQQIMAPSALGLLIGMANSGFAFYLFGYQVHEKSILLPLLPITALSAWEPAAALWAPLVASFSMFPLLQRDGVALAYTATLVIYFAVLSRLSPASLAPPPGATPLLATVYKLVTFGGLAAGLVLHAARELVPPPERLPWLHDRACVTLSFVFIASAMLYFNWRQWNQPHGGRFAGEAVPSKKVAATPKPAAQGLGRRSLAPKTAVAAKQKAV